MTESLRTIAEHWATKDIRHVSNPHYHDVQRLARAYLALAAVEAREEQEPPTTPTRLCGCVVAADGTITLRARGCHVEHLSEWTRGYVAGKLAGRDTPPPPDTGVEAVVVANILTHWFVQGGHAQFGELHDCHNADEVVSEILRVVRAARDKDLPSASDLIGILAGGDTPQEPPRNMLTIDADTIKEILTSRFGQGDPGSGLSMDCHEAHALMALLHKPEARESRSAPPLVQELETAARRCAYDAGQGVTSATIAEWTVLEGLLRRAAEALR